MGPISDTLIEPVARLRHRLFSTSDAAISAEILAASAAQVTNRGLRLRAGIAEFLLIRRLKARTQPKSSADLHERASHIVFVTSQHWFVRPDGRSVTRCVPL